MKKQPNFRPRVIEPANDGAPGSVGVGVELEMSGVVPGLHGDTVLLYMTDDSTMEQAEQLRNLLHQVVVKIAVSNPK